ncbi:MAG: hypothetical protein ABFS86_08725 [Planctomycetota bacterium]
MEATASFRSRSHASGLPFLTTARGDLPRVLIDVLPTTGETDSHSVIDL